MFDWVCTGFFAKLFLKARHKKTPPE